MGNNSGSPFMVVFLVVVIAVAAGFLFKDNYDMYKKEQEQHAALRNAVGQLTTANAKGTEVASINATQAHKLVEKDNQLSTLTANGEECTLNRASLENKIKDAQSKQAQAEAAVPAALATVTAADAQVKSQSATLTAMINQNKMLADENRSLKSQIAQQQTTPIPVTAVKDQPKQLRVSTITEIWEPALLPSLGIGLFGLVVFASYRMLKMEEQPGKQVRKYSADAETVLVKMTRQEASHYGRGRSKGTK